MSASYTCDRCQRPITTDRTVFRVESGPLRRLSLDATDLCPECAGALLVWFETGRQADVTTSTGADASGG